MPVELLLLIVFIVLPLIQQLLRVAKEREQGQRKPPSGQPPAASRPTRPMAQAPSQIALPPAPVVPPPLATLADTAMKARRRTAPRSTSEAVIAVPAARRSARRRILTGLRSPRDLQGAMVLMTILGPCRALAQDDRSGRVGVRPLTTSR
jgi:hypothetical protein